MISNSQYPPLTECAAYAKTGLPMMLEGANARTPLIFSWTLIFFFTSQYNHLGA
jgi:hypothetical protein